MVCELQETVLGCGQGKRTRTERIQSDLNIWGIYNDEEIANDRERRRGAVVATRDLNGLKKSIVFCACYKRDQTLSSEYVKRERTFVFRLFFQFINLQSFFNIWR